MSAEHSLTPRVAVACWAGLVVIAALYGIQLGISGPPFAATLAVFVVLLGGQVLFASPALLDRARASVAARSLRPLLPLLPLLAYLIYAVGTNTFDWQRVGFCAVYALAPALALYDVTPGRSATWRDYVAALFLWLPVELHWVHRLWPYPQGRLSHVLTALLAINIAVTAFLLLRRLEGIGYVIGWGSGWGRTVGVNFLIFAAIAVPFGQIIGFIRFEPAFEPLPALPLTALGIFLFTAWPEELLFRGLLQNLLGRSLGSAERGWIVASVIFGLSHINNGPFPNWRYVLLGTIAGFFYGRAWRKTSSIFASALVHTLVNTTWHLLFRTL